MGGESKSNQYQSLPQFKDHLKPYYHISGMSKIYTSCNIKFGNSVKKMCLIVDLATGDKLLNFERTKPMGAFHKSVAPETCNFLIRIIAKGSQGYFKLPKNMIGYNFR